MSTANDGGRIMLKGIVLPVDWDRSGNVRTVEIFTDGEGEFEVAPGGAGDQLKLHLRREVLAEAVVLPSTRSVKEVRVNSFAILDWVDSDIPNVII